MIATDKLKVVRAVQASIRLGAADTAWRAAQTFPRVGDKVSFRTDDVFVSLNVLGHCDWQPVSWVVVTLVHEPEVVPVGPVDLRVVSEAVAHLVKEGVEAISTRTHLRVRIANS